MKTLVEHRVACKNCGALRAVLRPENQGKPVPDEICPACAAVPKAGKKASPGATLPAG